MNMNFKRKLPIPMELKEQYPLPEVVAQKKAKRDAELQEILFGKSKKFLLVLGPCSADRKEPVLEYLERLREVQNQVDDQLFLVPRVFTNKPRSLGCGYLGMLHQPDPLSEPDILKGLIELRKLHIEALTRFGFGCADELLYPENYRYVNDLLSYVTVGARSVENQQHRLTASGLSVPCGMKNPISGDLTSMLNAIACARAPHTFLYRGWEVETEGNPLVHGILRGYTKPDGTYAPNYRESDLLAALKLFDEKGLAPGKVLVDCNHANSGKDYLKQPEIAMDVMKSRRHTSELRGFVRGLMLESYLLDGAQDERGLVPGLSITDPCLGFEKTKELIYRICECI